MPCNPAAFTTNSDYMCSATKMCKRKTMFQGFYVGVMACSSGSNHYKVRGMLALCIESALSHEMPPCALDV